MRRYSTPHFYEMLIAIIPRPRYMAQWKRSCHTLMTSYTLFLFRLVRLLPKKYLKQPVAKLYNM
jgi:hypothetical protein